MELSQKIIEARKKKGLTQEQLADLAHVTVRTIQRIESGESIPRTFTIKSLAEALGTSFEELTRVAINNPSSGLLTADIGQAREKHILKLLCFSCFSYLVIPLIHFLAPLYFFRKARSRNPASIEFSRTTIRQQIYWTIILCLLLIFTLAYNFIAVVYTKEPYLIHYLWPFLCMYILNAAIIVYRLRLINKLDFKLIPAQ